MRFVFQAVVKYIFSLREQMIAENVKKINDLVAGTCLRCGRDPRSVTVVAVSKTFGISAIREAAELGLRDFGENFVQELLSKHEELGALPLRWHFVGHLQTNKVKYLAPFIALVHSVDSMRLGEELSRRAVALGRSLDILVEVNTSGESSKFGVAPGGIRALVASLGRVPGLRVRGLMTLGPLQGSEPEVRASFRTLRELLDDCRPVAGPDFKELSMGMSGDFESAIEEGATMVRIGTGIFGARGKKSNHTGEAA